MKKNPISNSVLPKNHPIRNKYLKKFKYIDEIFYEGFFENLLDNYSPRHIEKIIEEYTIFFKKMSDSDYGKLKIFKLEEAIESISECKINELFIASPNSIYIPKVGYSNCFTKIDDLIFDHHMYLKLSIREEIFDCTFLKNFFNTNIGKSLLKTIEIGKFKEISKETIGKCLVFKIDILAQKKIASLLSRFNTLKEQISDYEKKLALNPISSNEIHEKINQLLHITNSLTISDRVLSIIFKGESERIEFKSTLYQCLKTKKKEEYIKQEVIKTIIGFMNQEGGELLIGVNDNGEIIGVDEEIDLFYQNEDKYLVSFTNVYKTAIGSSYGLIKFELINIDHKKVLYVSIGRSTEPIYDINKDFYLRTGNQTNKLIGPELNQYIQARFYKNN
jgi:hypothetical protein